MAHGLRYYKELTHADGKVVRLELLQKDYAGASMEIGPVCQSLRLDIQGDTEIDAPIVKTSLSMTFVDAPDHVDAKTKKCGNWAEFYTNDATYWQVVVKAKNAGETAFRNVWGGYVTPDSYNEVLVYRGSVTIVARDNIGHLSDFPFDAVGNADGMITLIELIREAWDKIESPMWLDDQAVANADWLMSEGAYAYDTYMNVSAFESKNWYDALESALYAYGLVMRYTGWNNVSFYSLRNMPRMGAYEVDDIDYREPVFEAGAERELTPAVKRIEESVEYEIESDFASAPKTADFSGSIITTGYYNRELWPLSNTAQGKGWANADASKTLFVNPKAYAFLDDFIIDEDKDNIYNEVYMNGGIEGDVEFSRYINSRALVAELKLGRIILMEKNFSDPSSKWQIASALNSRINAITYAISIEKNGITKWLQEDGTWTTAQTDLTQNREENDTITSLAVTVPSDEFTGVVLFSFHIKNIQIDQNDSQKCVALYGLSIAPTETTPLAERNNVNTNYDNTNNVILSREPKLAPALNVVALPSIIRNGIFVKSGNIYNPAKTWYWGGQTPQQMAVYNHLQLLCYHAKPNNVLRGTIVNADVTDMQVIWMWHGAEHMFVSGSFNLLSGHIENAVLREFARYEDMWGMLDPADLPDVDGKSVTNVESGSASKSEGARNTINTEVYLGGGNIVLDDYMSDTSENGVMNRVIKAYVDNLWHLDENGNLVTDKQVLIKNNLIIDGDTSSGGSGEDTPIGGISGVKVNGVTYYDDNGDGIVDLGTISGGGGTADLSSYYTKAESDARYLASSLLGSNTLIHSGNVGSYNAGGLAHSNGTVGAVVTSSGTIQDKNGDLLFACGSVTGQAFSRWQAFGSPSSSVVAILEGGHAAVLKTNNVERLWVNSSGNVGVGTTELYDANKLRLVNTHPHQHTWSLGYLAQESDFSVEFKDTFGGGVYGLYTSINYYTGYVAMQVGRSDGLTNAYGLMLQPLGGNVGIGTDSPSYKLDVNGQVRAEYYNLHNGAYITQQFGFLCLQSVANELCIGANGYENIHINYRPSADGTAPKTYYWRAGTATSWADHYVGTLLAMHQVETYGLYLRDADTAYTQLNMFGLYVWDNVVQFTRRDLNNAYQKSLLELNLNNDNAYIYGNLIVSGDVASA